MEKLDLSPPISDFKASDLNNYIRAFIRKMGVREGKYKNPVS